MRKFGRFRFGMALLVCLGFTGGDVVWADPAQDTPLPMSASYIEDPYAPHVTNGSTVRLGTAVGFIYGERLDVTAIGGTVAAGHRFNRLTLEAEFAYLSFQARGADDHTALGNGSRLGVMARFDVIRLGPHTVGPNSLLSIYVEGGAAQSWNHWYKPGMVDRTGDRIVPDDSQRVEGQVGFGIELDHRLQEPISFPHRIGWFLGWRLGLSPHAAEAASICRGVSCSVAPMMPEEHFTDRSMLFQSSLAFTW